MCSIFEDRKSSVKFWPRDGKQKPIMFKLLKPTKMKCTLIICLSLLINELIPGGWKPIDNMKEKMQSNKNDFLHKNVEMSKILDNLYHSKDKMGTLDDSCLWDGSCNSNVNVIMWRQLLHHKNNMDTKSASKNNWAQAQKIKNRIKKSYNGNNRNSIHVMHWNLGPRFWDNKREDVQHLVDEYKPDYVFISEANLFHDTPPHKTEIEGYDLVMARTMETLKFSRIILLCKKGAQYKVETNRMSQELSSIWVKLSGRGRKSLLLGGVYRDHYNIRQQGVNNSRSKEQQEHRWDIFIRQWVAASNNGECLILGDTNLDILRWDTPDFIHENMIKKSQGSDNN